MTSFEVYPFNKSTVAYLKGLRASIKVDPIYQRQGEVWTLDKQKLLIDSIINGFDIPKIYLHAHASWVEKDGERYKYSLVDGRQRLEAIWDFLDGKFALADDFVLLEDNSQSAAGQNYAELEKEHPEIATSFSATNLDVMLIRTGDVELIEEMFSRLNEAVPLNAAEKRNGRGGPLRDAVLALAETDFFRQKIPFTNNRYRHFDLSTKFLLWAEHGGARDTKKRQLDDFWTEVKEADNGVQRAASALDKALNILNRMSGTFVADDRLLSSVGMVSVYFLYYESLLESKQDVPLRAELECFERARKLNRPKDEDSLSPGERRLLEFDRLAQSPNDVGALNARLSILKDFLGDRSLFRSSQ